MILVDNIHLNSLEKNTMATKKKLTGPLATLTDEQKNALVEILEYSNPSAAKNFAERIGAPSPGSTVSVSAYLTVRVEGKDTEDSELGWGYARLRLAKETALRKSFAGALKDTEFKLDEIEFEVE